MFTFLIHFELDISQTNHGLQYMCCKAIYVHIEIVLTYMRVFTYICIIMYLHSISRQLVSTHSAQFTLTKRPFKRSGFKAEPPKPAKPSSEVKAAPKTATCLDRSQRGRY